LNSLGILNIEMEASALLWSLVYAGCARNDLFVFEQPRARASLYDDVHDALKSGWLHSIEAALETAVSLDL